LLRAQVYSRAELERFSAEIRMVQELQRILGVSVADAEEPGQYSERELREMKRAICEELTERRKS
jgi:hypothetical protein